MIYLVGILLGIELTVCGSTMDENWIANNTKTYKNKAHLSRVIIFFTTKMSIYRPYMQIGDFFSENVLSTPPPYVFLYIWA